MRLINADALLKILESDDSLKHARRLFTAYVNDQPTAFDVDEVVRQIQDIMSNDSIRFANQVVNRVINILKGAVKK